MENAAPTPAAPTPAAPTPAPTGTLPDWLKPGCPAPEWLEQIAETEYPGATFNAGQTRMILRLLPYLHKVPTLINVVKELREQFTQLHGHVQQAASGLSTLASAVQGIGPELEAMRVAVAQGTNSENEFARVQQQIKGLEDMIDDLSNSVNERIADLSVGTKPKPPRARKSVKPSDVPVSDVPVSAPDVPPPEYCGDPLQPPPADVPPPATVTPPQEFGTITGIPVPVAAPVPVAVSVPVPVAAPVPVPVAAPVPVPVAAPVPVPETVPALSTLDTITAQLDALDPPKHP